MSTENIGGGADAPTTTSTAPVAVTPTAPATEVAAPSKGDWAGLNKTLRDQAAILAAQQESIKSLLALQSPPKAEPAKPADAGALAQQLADLNRRLSIRDALAERGVTDPKVAARLERVARAENPTDLGTFVSEFIADFVPAKPAVAATIAAPIAPSNTGAPAASPTQVQLPDNPALWPEDVLKKMTTIEIRKALDDYDTKQGKGNPFRRARPPRT